MACGACSGHTGGGCGCGTGNGCATGCPTVNVHDWIAGKAPSSPQVVEVTFKHRRRDIFRYRRSISLTAGANVVVSLSHGVDFGKVTMAGELVMRTYNRFPPGHHRVIRLAGKSDHAHHKANRESEKSALKVFAATLQRRGHGLRAVDVEWQLDRKRITFYYQGKKQLPRHPLIAELRREFRDTQILLRRINEREEAARIGGIGICGRELCCATWMRKVSHVKHSAARQQHFPLTQERLLGRCNQLKCCLTYELDHYVEALRAFPRFGKKVDTPRGRGTVEKVDIFGRQVSVRMSSGFLETVPLDVISTGKPRRT